MVSLSYHNLILNEPDEVRTGCYCLRGYGAKLRDNEIDFCSRHYCELSRSFQLRSQVAIYVLY
jgi:hypothetical protein